VHNKYAETHGWVRTSCAFLDKEAGQLKQVSLGEGLGLRSERNIYALFRDALTGLEFIRESRLLHEKGLEFDLGAYQAFVFTDFKEVVDDREHSWRRIHEYLNGAGSYNLEQLRLELPVMQVLRPWREIANRGYLGWLLQNRANQSRLRPAEQLTNEAAHKYGQFLEGVELLSQQTLPRHELNEKMLQRFRAVFKLAGFDRCLTPAQRHAVLVGADFILRGFNDDHWLVLFLWVFLCDLAGRGAAAYGLDANKLLEEWRLGAVIKECLGQMDRSEWNASRMATLVKIILRLPALNAAGNPQTAADLLRLWMQDELIHDYLGVNTYEDITWFNQEGFEELVWWQAVLRLLDAMQSAGDEKEALAEQLVKICKKLEKILFAEKQSEFKLQLLMNKLEEIKLER